MALGVSPHYLAGPMGGRTTPISTEALTVTWRPRPLATPAGCAARLALAVALGAGVGCERPPSPGSAKEWTPADHHSQDDDRAQGRPSAPSGSAQAAPGKGDDAAQLVEIAWRQQCATCHGPSGKGDGPMGAMMQAPDLTRAAWQTKASDADIAAVIQSGRNKMPRFDLPDPVVRGLVARIRSLRGS
jgi:cytochrome c oxidase cbb3-type subunit 3